MALLIPSDGPSDSPACCAKARGDDMERPAGESLLSPFPPHPPLASRLLTLPWPPLLILGLDRPSPSPLLLILPWPLSSSSSRGLPPSPSVASPSSPSLGPPPPHPPLAPSLLNLPLPQAALVAPPPSSSAPPPSVLPPPSVQPPPSALPPPSVLPPPSGPLAGREADAVWGGLQASGLPLSPSEPL